MDVKTRREILAPGLPARVILSKNRSYNVLKNTLTIFSEQACEDKTIGGFHVATGVTVRALEFFENKLDVKTRILLQSKHAATVYLIL